MPVLAIGGQDVLHGGPRVVMKTVANDVQGLVIPGAGHFVAEEAPEQMIAALTEFLAPYRDESRRAVGRHPPARRAKDRKGLHLQAFSRFIGETGLNLRPPGPSRNDSAASGPTPASVRLRDPQYDLRLRAREGKQPVEWDRLETPTDVGGSPSLLGRRAECDALKALLDDALHGRTQVLILRGDAGYGQRLRVLPSVTQLLVRPIAPWRGQSSRIMRRASTFAGWRAVA